MLTQQVQEPVTESAQENNNNNSLIPILTIARNKTIETQPGFDLRPAAQKANIPVDELSRIP